MTLEQREHELFQEHLLASRIKTDKLFSILFVFQWILGIVGALVLSPFTWSGNAQLINIHVYLAVFLGGLLSFFPMYFIWRHPGEGYTRQIIAIAQSLTSVLLIHLSGGRIETHFHVFGSLAVLAFYLDCKVLLTATIITALDHFLRGMFLPMSVFGVDIGVQWRWLEHTAWVIFIDVFLLYKCKMRLGDFKVLARSLAELEEANNNIEKKVVARTEELRTANTKYIEEIDKRRESENQLGERSRELEAAIACQAAFMNNIPDMAWMKDKDSRFIRVNESLARFANRTIDEFIGKSDLDIWPEDLASAYILDDKDVIKSGSHKKVIEKIAANGKFLWIETIKTPFQGETGEFIGTVGIARDITDIKENQHALELAHQKLLKTNQQLESEMAENLKMHDQLVQAEKMEAVGILTGGIAHDFNNILWMILGNSEMLLDSIPQGSTEFDMQQDIHNAAERAKGLVKQLLDFSRKSESTKVNITLAPLIREVLKLLRSSIPATIDIQSKIDPIEHVIHCDPNKFHQVLMNLVTNAYHAIGNASGTIEVTLKDVILFEEDMDCFPGLTQPGLYQLVEVKDTGCGIPKEVINNIFDPFFTTKEVGVGTGLGLSTVHGIIAEMGGQILVYSDLGKGTAFQIYLPVSEEDAAMGLLENEVAPCKPLSPDVQKSVLIVDDEPMIRTMVQRMFEKLGYKTFMTENGVEALITFMKHQDDIDLIFTDQTMPQLTGMELAHKVFEIKPNFPIIVASGNSLVVSEDELAKTPVQWLINKPVQIKLLKELLEEIDSLQTAE